MWLQGLNLSPSASNISWLILWLFLFLQESQGLRCYKCGTKVSHSKSYGEEPVNHQLDPDYLDSCTHFEKEGSSPQHLVACAQSQICVKIVTRADDAERMLVQRGCAQAETVGGFQHAIGCGTVTPTNYTPNFNILEHEHACYCNTNYCNFGLNLRINIFIFILSLLLLLMLAIMH